jgi:hypothetical protein
MEQWQDDTDRGKLKYTKKNLSQCYLVNHRSYMETPGIENRPPQ